ncbi:hypothetical protein N9349_02270 [Candidatus Pelagibacter sp.]|nr:hypothetical protein [Candidatus Pelagibacter sp.]
MKKINFLIIVILMSCNAGFSEEPTFDIRDMNKNIIEHGWEVKNSKITRLRNVPVEIYTLMKGNWILKCQVLHTHEVLKTFCMKP